MRQELLESSDEIIEEAVQSADLLVLRAILYQLTGDRALESIPLTTTIRGHREYHTPANRADIVAIRLKAIAFLKSYRDSGAGPIDIGPCERLPDSINMLFGEPVEKGLEEFFIQDLAIDPWSRGLRWQHSPDPDQLANFSVTIVGAGMAGLNAGAQLGKAGIHYTVIEKNAGVGGTWHENRYPGARVDTPSRCYTHVFGVDFGYPSPYCEWHENERYLNWVADEFGVRKNIIFNTEVRSLIWDESDSMWTVRMDGPDGERVIRSNAVMTAVGFLNRPNIPEIPGACQFRGFSWHTSRWPDRMNLRGKRIAVIGTGATGYQLIPELARVASHVTIFQRTPQWMFPVPGYTKPFTPQVAWLDRNMPFHTNFMRAQTADIMAHHWLTQIDPNFDDPDSCNEKNKLTRDACLRFLEAKVTDLELRKLMTPSHLVWSSRLVMVDSEYCFLDVIQSDRAALVTGGIKRINPRGIEDQDGNQHNVDIIIYATGFRAADYFYPMEIRGKDGLTVSGLWGQDGPKAYLGCMMPGFPNLWSIYGPNTNGGLPPATFHEMTALYAMKCIERMIVSGNKAIEVKEEPYLSYNHLVDERNRQKVWSDRRTKSYYWSHESRTATQCPFSPSEMWKWLNDPEFTHLEMR